METILVELSNKKQSTMLKELLRELKIYFIDVPDTVKDNLSGENFKQSLLKIREEYVQGKTEEFKEVKIENLNDYPDICRKSDNLSSIDIN